MKEQGEESYSFCPECGALMENGVCPSCAEKQKGQGVYSSQSRFGVPSGQYPNGQGGQNMQYPNGQSRQYPSGQGGQYPNGQSGQYTGAQAPISNQSNDQSSQYLNGQNGQYAGAQAPAPNQPNDPRGQYTGGQNAQYPSGQNNQYPNGQYAGGSGGWYQNGQYQNWQQGGPNRYPGYPYPGGGPAKKQGGKKGPLIAGIAAAAVFVLLSIAGSFFYGYFIIKEIADKGFHAGADREDWGYDLPDGGDNSVSDGGGSGALHEERDPEEGEEEEEEEYVPSPDDTYYYGPVDAINYDVDYSFLAKSYTNEDPEHNIDVIVNYYELRGENIPNIDQLNEALEKVALYYAVDYPKYSYSAEYGESYNVYTTAYVTYNDEDVISIVLDEYVVLDNEYHVDLYPLNIDVKNGVLLDNGSILDIDEDFAKEFRKRSREQNGSVAYLDSLTDGELTAILRDKQSIIAYYTPLGMEIGVNYITGGSSGWVTVTYKDYKDYQAKF